MSEIKNKVIEEIKKIFDPEIPVNIYELGLIYKIEVDDKNKVIAITGTSGGIGLGIVKYYLSLWWSCNNEFISIISFTGTPSVIQIINLIPDRIASMIASLQNGAGTKIKDVLP